MSEQTFYTVVTDPFFWGYIGAGVSSAAMIHKGNYKTAGILAVITIGCMILGKPV